MPEKTSESFAERLNRICAQLQDERPSTGAADAEKSPVYTWSEDNAWASVNFSNWGNFGSR